MCLCVTEKDGEGGREKRVGKKRREWHLEINGERESEGESKGRKGGGESEKESKRKVRGREIRNAEQERLAYEPTETGWKKDSEKDTQRGKQRKRKEREKGREKETKA